MPPEVIWCGHHGERPFPPRKNLCGDRSPPRGIAYNEVESSLHYRRRSRLPPRVAGWRGAPGARPAFGACGEAGFPVAALAASMGLLVAVRSHRRSTASVGATGGCLFSLAKKARKRRLGRSLCRCKPFTGRILQFLFSSLSRFKTTCFRASKPLPRLRLNPFALQNHFVREDQSRW